MKTHEPQPDPSPWWAHRWPWILMLGPLIAAVGCAITIWVAHANPDTSIKTEVVKHALKITRTEQP